MKLADGYELDPAVPVDQLRPHPDNPNQGDVGAIVESIETVGFYGVVTAQKPRNGRKLGRILAGEHRWLAAKAEGAESIPVNWLDVDDEESKRILLGDNQIARLASLDMAAQAAMLTALAGTDRGLAGTGTDGDDLDQLLNDLANQDIHPQPEPPPPDEPPSEPITTHGDIWTLGRHRVMCGDSRDPTDVATLIDGAQIHMAFTSPPYADRRKYDESTTFKPIRPDDYVDWFAPVAANVAQHLASDGSWFVNIKAGADGLDTELYVIDLVVAHARQWGWHFATEYCWERNGVPKNVTRRFKNQFEPIYQFTRGEWKMRPDEVRHHSDNVPKAAGPGVGNTSWGEHQGGNGAMFGKDKPRRNGTSEFMSEVQGTAYGPGEMIGPGMAYPGNRLPTFAGSHEATGHTAAFPVGLPEFFVRAYTDPDDNIYDPFMGSGSTLLAAHNQNRNGYGIEISPAYCDVIAARYQRHTGDTPSINGRPHDFT